MWMELWFSNEGQLVTQVCLKVILMVFHKNTPFSCFKVTKKKISIKEITLIRSELPDIKVFAVLAWVFLFLKFAWVFPAPWGFLENGKKTSPQKALVIWCLHLAPTPCPYKISYWLLSITNQIQANVPHYWFLQCLIF